MAERVNILKTDYEMDRTDWTQVVSAVFGGMLRVQDMIEMYVAKGQGWNVDFATHKIKIGNSTYPIQFIGSESIQSNDWLWGWKNINGFDDSLLELIISIYKYIYKAKLKVGQKSCISLCLINSFEGKA